MVDSKESDISTDSEVKLVIKIERCGVNKKWFMADSDTLSW